MEADTLAVRTLAKSIRTVSSTEPESREGLRLQPLSLSLESFEVVNVRTH